MEWSFAAVTLLIVACIAVGVTSAVVCTWRLRLTLLELSDAVIVLQGIQNREVKVRAGQERWKKPDKDHALAQDLLMQGQPVQRPLNWWERGPGTKGAYVP
jgi:hypothetical protein